MDSVVKIWNSTFSSIHQSAHDYLVNKGINMDEKQLEFAVFCLENVAEHLNLSGDKVYKLLTEDSNILDSYIIPNYDTLHTQGKHYIVDDIVTYMRQEKLIK